jgi:hypothetical protein
MLSARSCTLFARLSLLLVCILSSGTPALAGTGKRAKGQPVVEAALPVGPAPSAFFASGTEEPFSSYQMHGDGDLWPSCWADDDNLYTANGDGSAFTEMTARPDMQVSRISGMPPQLTGTPLAADVGTNWSGKGYNRKPTGMLCLHGALYLAFQNLDSVGFNSAPAASIARSTDHGLTWQWDARAPMFGGAGKTPLFTTVFFLDFGKDSADRIDGYVYAYGLDTNWRSQQAMYLGRVKAAQIQKRKAWQFYAGLDAHGRPRWTSTIEDKRPVLRDTRMVAPENPGPRCPAADAVIAQGGVVYDKPLRRYLFSSWSCSSHEFYEAPTPWGPWRHVLSRNFGATLEATSRGQYGTTVPSKFISADGTRFLLQSNVCCGGDSYTFSLRGVQLELAPSAAEEARSTVVPARRWWIPGFRSQPVRGAGGAARNDHQEIGAVRSGS